MGQSKRAAEGSDQRTTGEAEAQRLCRIEHTIKQIVFLIAVKYAGQQLKDVRRVVMRPQTDGGCKAGKLKLHSWLCTPHQPCETNFTTCLPLHQSENVVSSSQYTI